MQFDFSAAIKDEEVTLGKKKVLRLSLHPDNVATSISMESEPPMDPVLKDSYIASTDEEGTYKAIFRTRRIDKKELKARVESRMVMNKNMGIRQSKKSLKEEILLKMADTAPIQVTEATFMVEGECVYILGSHKKVAETFFSDCFPATPAFQHITKLWESCGKPCQNVTLVSEEQGFTRVFKEDSDKHAAETVSESGHVIKFSDVFSYSLVNDRLVIAGEFVDLHSIDEMYLRAEETLTKES